MDTSLVLTPQDGWLPAGDARDSGMVLPGGGADRGRRSKRQVRWATRATLDTAGLTFAGFLTGVITIVGGLIYFRMLILGPIEERITG